MNNLHKNNWPLVIRLEVLPGSSFLDKFDKAKQYGFDAVELPGRQLSEFKSELLKNKDSLPLPISSISLGFRGSLISSDESVRKQCRDDLKGLLDLCAMIGAKGLVMPPHLYQDEQFKLVKSHQVRDELMLRQLPELAEHAENTGTLLLLEPVNRYETDYLNRIEQAAGLCEGVGSCGLGITADFFHMQIEELKPAESIKSCGKWIKHVHVAENTRVEPGRGSLDFRRGFHALQEAGYDGYIVIECRTLSGPPEEVLPASARYLRQLEW